VSGSDEGDRGRAVAVFGSSEPQPGEVAYEAARNLGRALAGQGLVVVNGGYGGVMEAASRGAREAGGQAIGVTSEVFASRGPGNRYLSQEIREPDLFARTRTLVNLSHGFVVLPGRAGTLAELAFLWALERAGLLGPRPIVLLGGPFPEIRDRLGGMGTLQASQLQTTRVARSIGEAADLIALGLVSFERFRRGESGA
jgi:uncharacterized protein (TIGR00730 family)